MSAAEQLDLGAIGSPKRKKEPATRFTCRCGHVRDNHANRMHSGACAICRGDCKRFRPKSKPPVDQPAHLAPPNGAIILERDELKNYKSMGWATVGTIVGDGVDAFNGVGGAPNLHAIVYLAQLRTKTPNENWLGGADKLTRAQIRQRYAAKTKGTRTPRERACSAISQLGIDLTALGAPTQIVVTRVASRALDKHDNVRHAMKPLVDGIADAVLGEDDSVLEDDPSRLGPGTGTHIRYAQEKCPQKVCGVRIEITWQGE